MCAADAPEKSCVDLADEADRNGKVRQSRKTMVDGGDVVDDLVDVARLMMSAEKVRLGREQILKRALAPFNLARKNCLLPNAHEDKQVRVGHLDRSMTRGV